MGKTLAFGIVSLLVIGGFVWINFYSSVSSTRVMIPKTITVQLNDSNSIDAYVKENAPDVNNGGSLVLCAGFWPQGTQDDRNRRLFIKFNSNIIPSGVTIVYVHLKLFVEIAPNDAGHFTIYQVNGSWTETAINWQNKPSIAAYGYDGIDIQSGDQSKWRYWNITQAIIDWDFGTSNNGLCIKTYTYEHDDANNDLQLFFTSSEGTTQSNRPKIEIKYLVPDSTAPPAPDSLIVNPDDWTRVNSFTVNWSNPDDPSGIIGAYYKLDTAPDHNTDGTFVNWTGNPHISDINVSGTGSHTIYVWLKDRENNVDRNNATIATLKYDGIPPNPPTDILIKPNNWTNSNSFEINWSCPPENDQCPIKIGVYYYIGSSPLESQSDGIWEDSKPITITNAPEGKNSIYLWLEDEVGNNDYNKSKSGSLMLDLTDPLLEIYSPTNGEWLSTSSVKVVWSGSDDNYSDIAQYEVKVDSKSYINKGNLKTHTFSGLNDSTHKVTVKARDQARNSIEKNVSFNIDTCDPLITISQPTNEEWLKSTDITIKWNGSDKGAGISHYKIKIDDGNYNSVGKEISKTFNNLSQGKHIITVMAIDITGNIKDSSIAFHVDTIKPTIKITDPINGPIIDANEITVSWEGSDTGSGIEAYYVRLNDGEFQNMNTKTSYTFTDLKEGDYRIIVRVLDKVGNIEETSVNFTLKIGSSRIDTDDDGYYDSEDVFPYDPNEWIDSDKDGYGDNSDAFPKEPSEWADNDNDGIGDNNDTDDDNDGMPDNWEKRFGLDSIYAGDAGVDTDKDGYTNLEEYMARTDPTDSISRPSTPPIDTDKDGISNAIDDDDDNDDLPDIWESENGLNPLNSTDAYEDKDGDGYTNLDEFKAGTNPRNKEDYPDKKEAISWWSTWEPIVAILAIIISILIGILTLTYKRRILRNRHIIIQNIKEYIAGDRVDIKDSVVLRSTIGGREGVKPMELPKKKTKIFVQYKHILQNAWADGKITEDEYAVLKHIRERGGITAMKNIYTKKPKHKHIKKKK